MLNRRVNNFYVLKDYYRQTIDLDTALDARHLVSVLSSVFPELNLSFADKCVSCLNLVNHMHQKIVITWKHQI